MAMSRSERALVTAAIMATMLFLSSCAENNTVLATDIAGTTRTTEAGTPETGSTETGPIDTGNPGVDEAVGDLAFGLQRCDPDAPRLTADPSFYRDEPIYVGNEQPVERVRDWARTQPGFEDIWLDRDHNGWISIGFSQDAAARQTDLESEFPGVGVVAVEVIATDAELRVLRDQVSDALQGLTSWGLSHSVSRGLVEASVPVLDEETLERLAPLADPRLCVDGKDPSDAVRDGPQPTGGDHWRLLGTERTGHPYRTGVATTPQQYAELWDEAGVSGEGPTVDFETEIVIWFGAVYGSGCPIRLDDVVIDTDRQLVHGDFVLPGNPTACNSDANGEAYIVAIPRDRLPENPFAVQLTSQDPPGGVPEERTTVQADLRSPGSTAAASDFVVVGLDDGSPPRPDRFEPGMVIEDGYPWTLLFDLSCDVDIVGPLNDTMWRAIDTEPGSAHPEQWGWDANDGLNEAEFLLTTSPPQLTITINDTTITYEPLGSADQATMNCA